MLQDVFSRPARVGGAGPHRIADPPEERIVTRPKPLTAITRFGLGPRPGEIREAAADPVEYVRAQAFRPESALLTARYLKSGEEIRDLYVEAQRPLVTARRAAREAGGEAAENALDAAIVARRDIVREIMFGEMEARFDHGAQTADPFVERLVLFWSNHFAVDRTRSAPMRFVAGLFEREAIRPHVLGFFADMLAAAVTHPAMLMYLDNHTSVGPNSAAARRRAGRGRGPAGVNENLAREVLELHTLGAGGGYTQADVIALAETLTGWHGGLNPRRRVPSFLPGRHEPGARTILGKTYAEAGAEQIFPVLEDLALHPSTARHLAGKFARHFVGDDAPPALIETMADRYLVTGGDLRALALALVESDVAWEREPAKTVPPYDFMVGAARALGTRSLPGRLVHRATRDLAQEIWAPPSPAGWPDDDRAFLGGDSMLERIDYARFLAQRFSSVQDVRERARTLFGEYLDPFVAEAVARAEDRTQAMVLLVMSPAFQRR